MAMEHEDLSGEIDGLLNDDDSIDGRTSNEFDDEVQAAGRQASNGRPPTVSSKECARWRRSIRSPSVTLTALGNRADVTPSTVRYHIRDACTHSVDEPRVTESQR